MSAFGLDAPGGSYWKDLLSYVRTRLLDARMISPEDLSLFKVTESAEEAVKEITGFFCTYHSMRYVRERLVFLIDYLTWRTSTPDTPEARPAP